ncbi:spermidine/putrescine ABC transporter substrate-binding protein [Ruminococcaceae bacterium OttesenSCG-928-L11]|nr:spermidine/putrescine ABC transporter substrate-binding protein [Ruminococcaceae bacterium OttesenSCG-928-L11]
MRKRWLSIALAALICLSFPAMAWAEEEDGGELELYTDEAYYTRFAGQGISINVYNWGEYISDGSDDTLNVNRAFQDLTGIRVYYSTYATNEELYSKLRSGNANYDVIIPSDYMIGRMINESMLLPLDKDNIPNLQYMDETFLNPIYDPGDVYSVPYTWGYVGVIYNKTLIYDEEELGSWDILWNEKYLGNILMFSNSRDAFAIAQSRNGYSLNTTDPDELRDCLEDLKAQKSLVQAYVMDEIFDKMLGGEAALAPYYAGDALTMMDDNEDLGFFIPEEGTNIFADAMCIPKGSREKEAAEMYINFMLEPEVGAANIEYIGYGTPNAEAKELLDEEITGNPVAYPSEEELANTEAFAALPQNTSLLLDELWTELLSNDEQYNRILVPMIMLAAILLSIGINVQRHLRKNKRNYFS